MLSSLIAGIGPDTYKVDAIRNYRGDIPSDDMSAIIEAIGTDTYKVDAIRILVGCRTFNPAIDVTQSIRADTYIVDAIVTITARHQPSSQTAFQMFSHIRADTYKVYLLKALSHYVTSKQVVPIIRSIRADTYKVGGLKELADKIEGEDVMTLMSMFSGAYKCDAADILRPLVRDEDVAAFSAAVEKAASSRNSDFEEMSVMNIGGMKVISRDPGTVVRDRNGNSVCNFGSFSPAVGLPWSPDFAPAPAPAPTFTYPDEDVKVKDDNDNCIVCADYYHRTINLPCGHACFCFHCAKKIGESGSRNCPACRAPITSIQTVYKV